MAFEVAEKNHVSKLSKLCKILLDEFYGDSVQVDAQWAGTPSFKTSITQSDLDSVSSFNSTGITSSSSGTVGTLPDAEFAVASIKTTVTNAIAALTILANLP